METSILASHCFLLISYFENTNISMSFLKDILHHTNLKVTKILILKV